MGLPEPAGSSSLPGWARAAVILAAGVVVAGAGDFALSAAGHPGLGAFVWAVGYGGAVLAVWLLVFRGRSFEPGAVKEVDGEASDGDGDVDANAGASASAPTGAAAVPEGYAPSSGTGSTGERKG